MEKVGRNDPCPCGSGKKYKKCCETAVKQKKFHAELLTPSTQAQETQETSKVSSLFFRKASTPKEPKSHEEPSNPVM